MLKLGDSTDRTMPVQLAAFYASLQEMKTSYSADLQMLNNYAKSVASVAPSANEHIGLLKNQLQLMIDTIEEIVKRR